jgi:hypothetical protein
MGNNMGEEYEFGVEREKMQQDEPSTVAMRPSTSSNCPRCGVIVTEDNYSGWDGFSEDLPEGMTAPLCTNCQDPGEFVPISVISCKCPECKNVNQRSDLYCMGCKKEIYWHSLFNNK